MFSYENERFSNMKGEVRCGGERDSAEGMSDSDARVTRLFRRVTLLRVSRWRGFTHHHAGHGEGCQRPGYRADQVEVIISRAWVVIPPLIEVDLRTILWLA